MTRKEFHDYLNSFCPTSDRTVEVWYSWAKDLEQMDSSYGDLAGGEYKTAEFFLNEFVNEFKYIRELYGDSIAGQVVSLADVPACPFPWEIKAAAKHLADGGSILDIPQMEADGTLEDYEDMDEDESTGMQMSPL